MEIQKDSRKKCIKNLFTWCCTLNSIILFFIHFNFFLSIVNKKFHFLLSCELTIKIKNMCSFNDTTKSNLYKDKKNMMEHPIRYQKLYHHFSCKYNIFVLVFAVFQWFCFLPANVAHPKYTLIIWIVKIFKLICTRNLSIAINWHYLA